MTIYYLYLKTHNITGLKYLGYTSKKDPFAYCGSGTRWRNHLRVHGSDISTEILFETTIKEQIRERGLYYSELWNIVDNVEFANLKPESGDGSIGPHHLMYDPEFKEKHRNATKEAMNRPEVKEKVCTARNKPEYLEKVKQRLHTQDIFNNRRGPGNPKFDHTIYTFVHETGIIEKSTRYELMHKYNLDQGNLAHLISGRCQKIKGWKVER
jgi:hypothetical protein